MGSIFTPIQEHEPPPSNDNAAIAQNGHIHILEEQYDQLETPHTGSHVCCSGHDHHHETSLIPNGIALHMGPTRGARAKSVDIEHAAALEHIHLLVDGMTCSGCANNLYKALQATQGVSNVQVNFVMGKADFTLNAIMSSPDDVIRAAERATGFRCIRQTGDDQFIDLLIQSHDHTAKITIGEMNLPGLQEFLTIDKNTVRVSYDPVITGARTLVDGIGNLSQGLAPFKDDLSILSGRKRLFDQIAKTIIAAVLTAPVALLAFCETTVTEKTKALISIVLATLVQFIAISEFYLPALKSLIYNGVLEMDMLVVISITAAYFYSVVAFGLRMAHSPLETPEFFETSTLLITLVLLGRVIAAYTRNRAVAAVSLRSLQPSTAMIIENGSVREIDSRLLQYGDKLKLFPHSLVPTDCLILDGSSEVDESMLTGESLPVTKKPGMELIAGTVNGSGTLVAQLTRLPGKNTVTDIAGLVEEASKSKPQIQDLADRVASLFVPVVSAVAIIVFILWVIIGLKLRNESGAKAVVCAITYAVAVLAISCPCALGLAVPMVLVVAGGIAARGGVVIKSGQCTERARKVTDVVFDKTGTLTEESMDVVAHHVFDSEIRGALAIVKALVEDNKHPISLAVSKFLALKGVEAAETSASYAVPGHGIVAVLGESVVKAGNPIWTESDSHPTVVRAIEDDLTVLSVTRDDTLIAMFALKARLRADAISVVKKLHQRSIAVHLVSGDQASAVQAIAWQVGIAPENIASRRTPGEKRAYVASLMAEGRIVMFCGDGTNDAVAVAQADVGVQLGNSLSSSDVTRGAADVVLLSGLGGIPYLLDISRSAFRRMAFNFVWAGVYNVLAILLASGAFVHVRIPPAYAGLGELVSVLPVVLVAMTMLLRKPPKTLEK